MSGQIPSQRLFPAVPADLQMPFRYASVQSMWQYFLVDPAEIAASLPDDGSLQTALFTDAAWPDEAPKALVSLDLQRYTGHASQFLESVVEVEFNVYAYPTTDEGKVPLLSWQDFIAGADGTHRLGGYRIHVPASNPGAVHAGQELYGEPKFLADFVYTVPAVNNPEVTTWQYTVQVHDDSGQNKGAEIFSVSADFSMVTPSFTNPSPLTEYGVLNGNLICNRWNFYGPFATYDLTGSDATFELHLGERDSEGVVADLHRLIGELQPVAAQVFESPQVAVECLGSYPVPIDGY